MTQAVWIIDDDKAIRWVLEKSLARSGIAYQSFSSADDALNALYDATPSVIISDIRMPGTDGLKFLGKVKQEHPALPVIIMTAHSDLDSAVAAFQGGAFEYLPKPFDVDQAVALIERALAESRSSEAASEDAEAMPALLGQAPAMQDVFRAIGRLSQSSVTVLITGESGTGKERVAEALHRHSVRSAKPFIALNTAAIPKDLLESELFGHEKGAFTGALGTRRGRFEEAEGGTLFLDEIGDMPTELQTRLLRVLSDGHFYRVGGHTPIKANVRVIAATHQHLEERVKLGQFREDLFHRLNVIRLRLPPLRERSEDIPLLVRHFLARSAANLGVEPKRLSEAAMALVQHYAFPGNVRQLENLCQWITVMAPGQSVEMQDLPPEFRPELIAGSGGAIELPPTADGSGVLPQLAGDWTMLLAREVAQRLAAGESGIIDDLTARFESTCIKSGLAHTGGRKVEAANLLGWGRNTLTRKIQELGLEHGE
ncbi:nitrogen regulation protein NR(I) [Vogesella indigofera]|uniref:nitrogen regulation protein NR(I) n=1 Tax=Vogesella indigofera TaxID=45465 RepID=UPI00234E7C27|nr:nitrogen regulation protein NR(I) [Vogesella indigofera]MDC7708750.1 nitrogen regulation protein NR(I) [Vogesella indigofera]